MDQSDINMDIDHTLYTLFSIIVVMVCYCKTVECELCWVIENKILQFGKDLSLSCQVENCCPESAGWGKWTSKNEFITIFINVKDLNVDKSLKYGGRTNNRGFSLVIHNVTRDDFNIAYSCTYGFLVSKKKMLLTTDAFLTKKEVDSVVRGKDNTPVYIGLIITLSLGTIAGIVVIVVCLKKNARQSTEMINQEEDVNSSNERLNVENINELLIVENTDTSEENERRRQGQCQQLQQPDTGFEANPNNSSPSAFARNDLRSSIGNRSNNSDDSNSYKSCKSTMSLHPLSIKQTEEFF